MLRRVILVAYLLIGIVIAAQKNYLTDLNTAGRVLSAVLAVLLWPLLLLGVHLTIK